MTRLFFLGGAFFRGGVRMTIRGVDSESARLGRRPLQQNEQRAAARAAATQEKTDGLEFDAVHGDAA